jgi:Leu/Phe-tRNA-protein transferase
LFDVQMVTPITGQMGARDIPREEYLRKLESAVAKPAVFSTVPHKESAFLPMFRAS